MKKILVIDDDKISSLLIISILKDEQYEVFEAKNGHLGIELAKKIIPDIILCDMRMPEVDGMEVLDAIRADLNMTSIPFVFITANTDTIDQKVAMKSGANAYLHKPINKNSLLDCIKKFD